jgi:chloramphenicol O-acetyltransferase type A
MFDRQSQLDHFAGYRLPVVSLTAECRCPDFLTPAKARGWPPFALVLHGLARASLDQENFRYRLEAGRVRVVERLTVGHAVLGAGERLNFSHVAYTPDLATFLDRYRADRDQARRAPELRAAPAAGLDFIYVTCLPWLRFTSLQNPCSGRDDDSVPRFAVGAFAREGDEVSFPLSVQAHHGLVDGIHISRLFEGMARAMGDLAQAAGAG